MLPVLLGIVGEGHCEGSVWRPSLQQKIIEILTAHRKQYSSTPIFLLCNQRNEFEKAAFEAALPYVADSMAFREMDYESIAKNSQLLFCIRNENDHSLDALIEIRHGKSRDVSDLRGLLYQRERGPVWDLICSEQQVNAQIRYPNHLSEKNPSTPYQLIWKNMDQFNRDAQNVNRYEPAFPLLPQDVREQLHQSNRFLLEQFQVCDRMATHFQKRSFGIYIALFVFSFAFVFFYDIYSNLVAGAPLRLPFYLASLVVAFVIYRFGKHKNYENKYLDYRALAEGMRVQFFWSLTDFQWAAADHYLHKSENELIWIRAALRSWYNSSLKEGQTSQLSTDRRLQIILENWIRNQNDYFLTTGKKNKKMLKFLKIGSTAFLYIAFALTVLKLPIPKPPAWLLALTSLSAAIGALVKGYIQNRGLSEHLKQYSRMAELYAFALEHTAMLKNQENANLLIQELGKEALAENAEWVLLHRDRRITFPGPK